MGVCAEFGSSVVLPLATNAEGHSMYQSTIGYYMLRLACPCCCESLTKLKRYKNYPTLVPLLHHYIGRRIHPQPTIVISGTETWWGEGGTATASVGRGIAIGSRAGQVTDSTNQLPCYPPWPAHHTQSRAYNHTGRYKAVRRKNIRQAL